MFDSVFFAILYISIILFERTMCLIKYQLKINFSFLRLHDKALLFRNNGCYFCFN